MSVRPRWVFVAVMGLSVLALVRTHLYYGKIYHGWDAQFYYSLARSLAFDQDTDVTNDLLLTPDPRAFDPDRDGSFREAPRRPDGRFASKYPIGMSLLEAPLVALGSVIRVTLNAVGVRFSGPPGYSQVELWTVALGLIAVSSAGSAVLYRLLVEEFGTRAALLGVIGCWGGTSLFYYSSVFPFMAHAVSFTLLVLATRLARDLGSGDRANRSLALLGLCMGAVILVRPQQAVFAVFMLPILVRCVRTQAPRRWLPGLVGGIVCGSLAVAAQLVFNLDQVGKLTLSGYSAGGEGFNWLSPELSFVLFSHSRGLLVFSPVVVLAALGYVRFGRFVPGYAWAGVGNAVAQVYLIAAWSSPEQGDSFGARMFSDNAAAVAFGLAVLAHRLAGFWQWLVVGVTLVAVGWTTWLMLRYIAGH